MLFKRIPSKESSGSKASLLAAAALDDFDGGVTCFDGGCDEGGEGSDTPRPWRWSTLEHMI